MLRKASHSCLLTYIRATSDFDNILRSFLENGFENVEWQVRQKSINSFQSLFLSEGRFLQWESPYIRNAIEILIDKSLDPNTTISKASEQVI